VYLLKDEVNNKTRNKEKSSLKDIQKLNSYIDAYSLSIKEDKEFSEYGIKLIFDLYSHGSLDDIKKHLKKYNSNGSKIMLKNIQKKNNQYIDQIELELINIKQTLLEYPPIYIPYKGFVDTKKWKVKKKGNKVIGKYKNKLVLEFEYKDSIDINDLDLEKDAFYIKYFLLEDSIEIEKYIANLEYENKIIIIKDNKKIYSSKNLFSEYFKAYIDDNKKIIKDERDFLKLVSTDNDIFGHSIEKQKMKKIFNKKNIRKIKNNGLAYLDRIDDKEYYVLDI
ncbi:MAG: hypothetical protein J7K26_01185, partial [Candidatus Aenigmarchaeota archaeon]|nr:hypothetical protein [Candidatus Aenigmarchaeota archaeon]